jgi:hypothetical protein
MPSVVGLAELRTALLGCLDLTQTSYANSWGFNPHITLSYLQGGEAVTPADVIGIPLEFRGIFLVEGPNSTFFPFEEHPEPSQQLLPADYAPNVFVREGKQQVSRVVAVTRDGRMIVNLMDGSTLTVLPEELYSL